MQRIEVHVRGTRAGREARQRTRERLLTSELHHRLAGAAQQHRKAERHPDRIDGNHHTAEDEHGPVSLGRAVDGQVGVKHPNVGLVDARIKFCLLYTSPSPRDMRRPRMPSSA